MHIFDSSEYDFYRTFLGCCWECWELENGGEVTTGVMEMSGLLVVTMLVMLSTL